jgi:AraC family transcriptional regulator, regulatory protein of adaptative response / DNA-3-methyladenine glycosylase II
MAIGTNTDSHPVEPLAGPVIVQDVETLGLIDPDCCYEALVARDHRFDGLFFAAVRTTRLYCRPICPGRPNRENVEFFRHATAAEAAGYRPCLRCRPEDAPPLQGTRDTFESRHRAAGTGERGESAGPSQEEARRNDRLDFSRKLVIETNLPLATIASVSCFRTKTKFAAAFEARFRRRPDSLRRSRSESMQGGVELMLPYRPPLDWQALLGFYRNHLIYGVESVDGDCYERSFEIGPASGVFRVERDRNKPRLQLRVVVDDPGVLLAVQRRVRAMFDLDAEPMGIGERFGSHPILGPLWAARPGLRIARGWDPFETSICTILGQLVSTTQGRSLVRQLVENHGKPSVHPITGEPVRLFPSPEVLASSGLEGVRTSEARKRAIRALSGVVASGELDLGGEDISEIKRRLLGLPGIGPWSSEYIALRGIGDSDAFPGTDLVLRRWIASNAGIELDSIRPWRGYAAVCFWLSQSTSPLEERGVQ